MRNENEMRGKIDLMQGTANGRFEEALNLDHILIALAARPAIAARILWQQERQTVIAAQLAANAKIKQRWIDSNPVEISQYQRTHKANDAMQVNAGTGLQ